MTLPAVYIDGQLGHLANHEEIAAHVNGTANVHGIANTALLVVTSDGRLTNARTPTVHAASHATGGSDQITPAAIGAEATGVAAALVDDLSGVTDAPTARTRLGLLSMATQAATAVAITGGTITGITDLAVADGGTGASTAAAARTALGAAGIAGDTFTGKLNASKGIDVTDDDGTTSVTGYRALTFLRPTAGDDQVCCVVLKAPGASWGTATNYAEGNYLVALTDADNFIATPTDRLATISATTNATPVAVTTGVHGFTSGDVVRITGTGIAALDNKWWKVTVTDTTHFTLNASTAPGSTASAGYAYTDSSPVLTRFSTTGIGVEGSIHLAAGGRGRSGDPLSTYGLFIQPSSDVAALIIDNPPTTRWTPAPVQNYITVRDARASLVARFAVNAAGQTVVDNGTAALPGLAFRNDVTTGLYSSGAGVVAFTVAGVLVGYFVNNQFNLQVPIVLPGGTSTLQDGANLILGSTNGTKIGTATTQKIGFYNSTPVVKPTVTGAKGSNAALGSLMTALAALGLVVDSTTA